MNERLRLQIIELTDKYRGLTEIADLDTGVVLSGSLSFEASAADKETITDSFDVEITIPIGYPEWLPSVRETGGRITANYAHLLTNGALCLAVPVEKRRVFLEEPSLLAFTEKLVIPYLYGYSYWKRHGVHPFDEAAHGYAGILQHYVETLKLPGEAAALAVICFLVEHGYRGHHDCPCGSRQKVRACHGPALRALHEAHSQQTLRNDFDAIATLCAHSLAEGQSKFPVPILQQVLRLMEKMSYGK